MSTNTLAMENGKVYTASFRKGLPGDNDVNITDTTTTRVSFTSSRIIITSQVDTWHSSTQKSKSVLKYIYDGNFVFGGNTLSSLRSASINKVTFAGHGLGYNPKTNLTNYSNEGAGALVFTPPYTDISINFNEVDAGVLYHYISSSTTDPSSPYFGSSLAPYMGSRNFSPGSATSDRSVITSDMSSTELKENWWVDPFQLSDTQAIASEFFIASTWSGDITIKSSLTASSDGGNLTAPQIDNVYKGWQGSILNGSNVNDQIYCKAGWDLVNGNNGDDLIRAGNGRDIITGGAGRDELWGDFGWNTYTSSKDGDADLIVVKSDQLLYNWLYEKAGNSPNGEKCDIIEELDTFDQIKILGASTSDLSFNEASAHGVFGIGIYASGFLEALYIGRDMNINQLPSITTGDDSEAVMNNTIQSYNWA